MSGTRHFFLEVLLPAYEEFIQQYSKRELGLQRDKRYAAALAERLLHLPEYAFVDPADPNCRSGYTKAKQYREAFWSLFPPYEIVCDFGNAWKHRNLDRKGRKLAGIDDVTEVIAVIRYQDSEGYYYATTKLLMARLTDGLNHDLAGCLVGSMHMWSRELVTRKVIGRLPSLPEPRKAFYTRQEVAQLERMRWMAYAGENASLQPVAMIYDSAKKLLVPLEKRDCFDCYFEHEFHNLPSPLATAGVSLC